MVASHFSIKSRLVLAVVGCTSLVLVLMYGVSVWWYAGIQKQNLDTFLHSEAAGVATTLDAFLAKESPASFDPGTAIQAPDFVRFLTSFLRERNDKPYIYKTTLQVNDLDGHLVAVSNSALNLNQDFQVDGQIKLRDWKTSAGGGRIFSVTTSGVDYRIQEIPLLVHERPVGLIRIACLLSPVGQSLTVFSLLTGLVLLVTVLIISLGMLFLVTGILRPVRSMSAQMNRVTERNLSFRLKLLDGNDELSSLALTFNSTLDRIENAYRLQEQLVSDLSHQLRTPLTSMRGSMELAMRKTRSVDEYQAILENSIISIDRITSLVNTMLTLAKLDGHMENLQYGQCDLVGLLAETIDELGPLWEEKSIQFLHRFRFYKNHRIEEFSGEPGQEIELPAAVSRLFVIEADVFRFKQAIINILDNAYKFTPEQGLITIELYREVSGDARTCRIVIMNSGPSVPDRILADLFTPFFHGEGPPGRTDTALSGAPEEHIQGFGLGLSICRRIVEMHQGKLRVYNPVAGGAAFEIILPVTQSDARRGI